VKTYSGSKSPLILRYRDGQPHTTAALYMDRDPGTHRTGGWVGTRTGLDVSEKSLAPAGIWTLDCPARSPATLQT